ncbi:3-deoxy-7-phosphoheptulonate synthase [Dasania sp. GY-MA-18]|uniref:Phospho-2-dehydro-3-deoxyheptonate aldolase n=1 Tax=Dasania phycosphaerae TaxID=2950436 RepID=A0A9J6RLL8_9GAMM|nr:MULTISPECIES: 3-deoxy-7-phosphoheptulonate synthase [Dasania]MCR8922787.1 3-deoxy-7-phosphoheptulonate synthase [Dasania sp. GY-MA-18]MCZ0865217.1 3-deoxy-7-phosphoheptulonate synthase [Dasania phycosphaerae]MCZ0868943.1 3-deoxy-7-phosphoheptulonate synthase [Dasania phycosphaerae]
MTTLNTTDHVTDDVHIAELRPLIAPAVLIEELPLSEQAATMICQARKDIENVFKGEDDRLVVVVGPCSIHDPAAALEYAQRIKAVMGQYQSELLIVMRTYFEKPRTTVGWKGLINDPKLDGSFNINHGLKVARKLLIDVADMGIPTGCEFLDTISPQFFADLVSWGAIGARTTESQIHRELASGLSMPVGFKNGTDGNLQIAIDAIGAASHPHHFLSVTKQGTSAIVETRGNKNCHIILRGSSKGPNYSAEFIKKTTELVSSKGLAPYIMVDCSHGNSNKDFARQSLVADNLAEQISAGEKAISGVMLESHLVEGNQKKPEVYGQSITDACISWDTTVDIFNRLAAAVKARRTA